MVRLLGNNLSNRKKVYIALTAVYGIGIPTAYEFLRKADIDPETKVADLTVFFLGELLSVVKNADGEIVEGDPKQVKRQRDIWTFSKNMGSTDPNWRLDATDE